MEERNLRKTRVGVVVSDKMDKTIVVAVKNNERHPLYNKIVKKTYKLKAHDENNDAKIGDTVRVMETRPLSKDKQTQSCGQYWRKRVTCYPRNGWIYQKICEHRRCDRCYC